MAEIRRITAPVCQAHKRFNKAFGIGANKTGTTSLQQILQIIGLKVAPQQEGELLGMQAYRGHFGGLSGYIERYDAFQDAPFSVKTTFAQVDALFPGSKFILTVREPEAWFNSLRNFHRKIMRVPAGQPGPTREHIEGFGYLYPGYLAQLAQANYLLQEGDDGRLRVNWDLAYDRDHYVAGYLERNRAVMRHFSERPDDLLVIDLTLESDTARVVDFLGLPTSLVTPMPHANKT